MNKSQDARDRTVIKSPFICGWLSPNSNLHNERAVFEGVESRSPSCQLSRQMLRRQPTLSEAQAGHRGKKEPNGAFRNIEDLRMQKRRFELNRGTGLMSDRMKNASVLAGHSVYTNIKNTAHKHVV